MSGKSAGCEADRAVRGQCAECDLCEREGGVMGDVIVRALVFLVALVVLSPYLAGAIDAYCWIFSGGACTSMDWSGEGYLRLWIMFLLSPLALCAVVAMAAVIDE